MGRWSNRAFLTVAVGLGMASCAERTSLEPEAGVRGGSLGVLSSIAAPLTLDDEFAKIAAVYPEFAGLFVDGDSVVVVVTPHPDASAAGVRAAAEFFAKHQGELSFARVKRRTVQFASYGFAQLATMREALYRGNLPLGIVYVDIDERSNRLVVGVQDDLHVASVAQHLQSLGLPLQAILVRTEILPPPVQTLWDRNRPVVAGLRLAFNNSLGQQAGCTMGWMLFRRNGAVVDSSTRYFITASHCGTPGGVGGLDAVVYYQGGIGVSADSIGQEVSDPLPYSGGNCPSGRVCRYSDASLIRMPSTVLWVHGGSAWSEPVFPPAFPPYVGWMMSPTVAAHAFNYAVVGIASGERIGTNIATCVDRAFTVGSNLVLKCQNRLNVIGASGDSGGPVFQYDSFWGFWRHARGLRWAATWNQANNTGVSDYSTAAGIEIDLGQFQYHSTCSSACIPW